jgi:hypothetical protein
VHRKTAEGIALRFGEAPRTLQRFLESIKWDEEKLRDRCQEIVARNVLTGEVKFFVRKIVGLVRLWGGLHGSPRRGTIFPMAE